MTTGFQARDEHSEEAVGTVRCTEGGAAQTNPGRPAAGRGQRAGSGHEGGRRPYATGTQAVHPAAPPAPYSVILARRWIPGLADISCSEVSFHTRDY